MKHIRYFFEAVFLYALFIFFKILPPTMASSIGGWVGRNIGPRLAASRKARRNILIAFPDSTTTRQDEILLGMWDNLGRVIAEYPHLERLSRDFSTIDGFELLEKTKNKPAIFFGGHFSNWEVNCAVTLTQIHHPADLTYRAPNNPMVAKLLDKARTLNGRIKAHPKSRGSARAIMQALKDKKWLGILIDQKYNEGVEAKFFGQAAMTNPIYVQLCQKYKCPLIPIINERISGTCRFKITFAAPINVFDDAGNPRPIIDVIDETHRLLESWVIKRPEQWLWLHRRWVENKLI